MTIYVPKVPISSLVGTVDSSFPVHLCIIDKVSILWFDPTKEKKTKVTSQNLLPRYIQIFGKFSVVGLIYIFHKTSTCVAPL